LVSELTKCTGLKACTKPLIKKHTPRFGLCMVYEFQQIDLVLWRSRCIIAAHSSNGDKRDGLLRGPPEQLKNKEMPWSTIAVHQGTNATQQMKSLVSPRSGLHAAHQNGDRQAMVEHNSGTDQRSDRSNDVDNNDEIQRRIWLKKQKYEPGALIPVC
jgi:hypothetical protein